MKNILITGGSGLIGKVLVHALAEAGHTVLYTMRALENAIDNDFENVKAIVCPDLGEEGAIDKLLNSEACTTHPPHILINNARDIDSLKLSEEGIPRVDQWYKEFDLAVRIPFELSIALSDQAQFEHVINIGSIYGTRSYDLSLYDTPMPQAPINYSICKAAQLRLTEELAKRLGYKNIRANTVSYGGVKGRANQEFEQKYAQKCVNNGMLEHSDLVAPILFLCSASSHAITGQNITIDNGFTL